MLKNQRWFRYSDDLESEIIQAGEEGKDISMLQKHIEAVIAMAKEDPLKQKLAAEIYDDIQRLDIAAGYEYEEPSDLIGITEVMGEGKVSKGKEIKLNASELYDKIYGAWLGRCSGCLLGKPVETWRRKNIVEFLMDADNYPITHYMTSEIPPEVKKKHNIIDSGEWYPMWINKVTCMPEDDDINYTVMGLKLLEKKGLDFSTEDIVERWLEDIPVLHMYTAERIAYRNFINLVPPPDSASYRNPCREWIGALIRGDIYGYVSPGKPRQAAELAWKDASVSHVKNGIYGEMFIAAMLAEAAVNENLEEIIEAGLEQIPQKCRLFAEIKRAMQWKREGLSWEQAVGKVYENYDEKILQHSVHTIPNTMFIILSLIYGELDFEKSIAYAVMSGMDTDSNGATVGSIVGMILGAQRLPEKWIDPINDRLESGVDGFKSVSISELAKRTVKLIK